MNLLFRLNADVPTSELLSEEYYVRQLLRVEQVVARAQGDAGVIPPAAAEAIVAGLDKATIDLDRLWAETAVVGYPVLPLIRQVDPQLDETARGYLHWGLTTQDVMDTALILQMREVLKRQYRLAGDWGDGLSRLVRDGAGIVAPSRTHAQQAVPTTMGARFAVFLEQVADLVVDLLDAGRRLGVVSMHGAGGTSAAMGPKAGDVRLRVAQLLGLQAGNVPWHVARQSLHRVTSVASALGAVSARLAREVIDQSRSEIAEVSEVSGELRGASSTMPQKANPIDSESLIGLAWVCTSNHLAMTRALEAGHERAAGEWQIEWAALPTVLLAFSSLLRVSARLCHGLVLNAERAQINVDLLRGEMMSEAYMMQFARSIGREQAHDVMYRAVRRARQSGESLHTAAAAEGECRGLNIHHVSPREYVGEADAMCASAQTSWLRVRPRIDTAASNRPDIDQHATDLDASNNERGAWDGRLGS